MHAPQPAISSEAVQNLVHRCGAPPDLAIILGSGLGDAYRCAEPVASIPYSEIPGFPQTTVSGHAGCLQVGRLGGWTLWFFCGRFHLYEGHSAAVVTTPVSLSAAAGAGRLLLTNAAGAIPVEWKPGEFMWIEDHLNYTGSNPLRGVRDNPFVDMTNVYANHLYASLCSAMSPEHGPLHRGVLACLPGPTYETPAEIRALRILGADAVSMSTVPEAIMARYMGMEVVGLSFLANAAAGVLPGVLDHRDVLDSARNGTERLAAMIAALVPLWQVSSP